MAEKEGELYRPPPVLPPSIEELAEISERLNLKCTKEELEAFEESLSRTVQGCYKLVDHMSRKTLPVKYPRTAGYIPTPEENPLNAWVQICNVTGASSGKLEGKKVAVKDSISVAGVPMANGSKLLEGFVPDIDATIVTRILDAGGIIAGKSSCEDLCASANSFTCVRGPVLNPHKKTHSAGGSSSGSAVLIAGGDVEMALGGDQGGSIRVPASWCGIVGLKPTHGLVPYTGAIPVARNIDHVGPMANNVENCALLLEVIAGYDDGFDPRQKGPMEIPEYTKQLTKDLTGMKIGLVNEGFDQCEDDVKTIVKKAGLDLMKTGAKVEEISIPLHSQGNYIFSSMAMEGSHFETLNGKGLGTGWKGYYWECFQQTYAKSLQARPYDLPPALKRSYLFGEYMHKHYHKKFYCKGMNATLVLTEAYDKALEDFDVLIMPTLPYKAEELPKAGLSTKELLNSLFGMTKNTCPFNATGHPALSINCGFSDGLPVGMMIIGRHFDETSVFKVAYSYEQIRDAK